MSPPSPANHIGFQHSHRLLVSMWYLGKTTLFSWQNTIYYIYYYLFIYFNSCLSSNPVYFQIYGILPYWIIYQMQAKKVQKVGLSTKEIWSKPLFYNWCVVLTQVWRNQTKQWIDMRLQYKTIVTFNTCITVIYKKVHAIMKSKRINFLHLNNC